MTQHDIFKSFAIARFNKLSNSFGVEHVLATIDGIGDDVKTDQKKKILLDSFTKCKERYTALVKQYLAPPGKIDLAPLISKIKCIPLRQQQSPKSIVWDEKLKGKALQLIAHIFAYWTLLESASYFEVADQTDARSYLRQPHDAQVLSVFRILGIGNNDASYAEEALNWAKRKLGLRTQSGTLMPSLVEIGTGEGKSLTFAVAACVQALLGFSVRCVCYSQYLSKRDYQEYEPLFNDFGV
eukprot:CAMPEP_0202721390 /NCGR_PEP_ID=MMETSP1385-20130828/148496_1 /ASSEMBLY_ACC=CAM_ASM_000861 /TAXON_ID=933848 /ORGANISM="Elphidium margaritaceum" /LENGTH=239 /DNA_ID=CAMNT_0049385595 /DNA_START=51 /DNA_END=766 /DNA_ORIENTATION=-